jgi:hypothetical protein
MQQKSVSEGNGVEGEREREDGNNKIPMMNDSPNFHS